MAQKFIAMDRAAGRCYHRIVSTIAGNQRKIGSLALVLVVVLVPGLLISGCYYSNHPISQDPGDRSDAGAGSDAASAGTDPDTCFGAAPFHVCLAVAPDAPFSVSPGELKTINTASDVPTCARTVSGISNACVVAATTITIEGTLRATGPRPLILIARDSISIQGTGLIDVGSHRGAATELGAGADHKDCVSGSSSDTGCGGAGGSFLGLGGMGGGMEIFCTNPGMPGPPLAGPITTLRGGCPGQDTPRTNSDTVRGGHGGGAVLLIAGRAITLTGGAINAAGEGGQGGSLAGGGGGGGSGGMIVLDAPTIASSGLLLASGGGGGGGASGDTSAGPGGPGADPSTVNAAAGGPGGPDAGGGGGSGSIRDFAAGGSNGIPGALLTGAGHGGGGGGGTGVVKAPATANLGLQVSPKPTSS